MFNNNRTYLDYAAATPIDPDIWEVFEKVSKEQWANPNAIHHEAQQARNSIEQARLDISKILNCKPREIIFTGSATESNNLALQGLVFGVQSSKIKDQSAKIEGGDLVVEANFNSPLAEGESGKILKQVQDDKNNSSSFIPHILISPIEHPSVLETAKLLQDLGLATYSSFEVDQNGTIILEDLESHILPQTFILSLIWVNNEIGTIQPINEILEKLSQINLVRLSQALPKILLHIDASQAFLSEEIDLNDLKIDLLTLSSHKIYAPRGTALLFVRDGVDLIATTGGGGQESGKRSGTQNTAGITAMAKAMQKAQQSRDEYKNNLAKIQAYSFQKLIEFNQDSKSELYDLVLINGPIGDERVVNNINFSLKNIDHQTLHTAVDLAGFSISGGSSCSSGSLEVSSVIQAIRLSQNSDLPQKEATLRLSIGKYTTIQELDLLLDKLCEIVGKLRNVK